MDRNITKSIAIWDALESLSARRAWIEMLVPEQHSDGISCRSPQGERG